MINFQDRVSVLDDGRIENIFDFFEFLLMDKTGRRAVTGKPAAIPFSALKGPQFETLRNAMRQCAKDGGFAIEDLMVSRDRRFIYYPNGGFSYLANGQTFDSDHTPPMLSEGAEADAAAWEEMRLQAYGQEAAQLRRSLFGPSSANLQNVGR
jgi:hypothetical protein